MRDEKAIEAITAIYDTLMQNKQYDQFDSKQVVWQELDLEGMTIKFGLKEADGTESQYILDLARYDK